ncbi:MAG: histidinol phosphatase [Clostridia bacterium]|nr:histidinol phosphatase [Clostridia bacterium]
MSYKYETHLHTAPVSKCASASVGDTLEFYKSLGYDGVFITNHFLDGNINCDKSLPYRDRIEFYFSDYEAAIALAPRIGIKVFFGTELSYRGTDFLVYGLDKEWYLSHPEIMEMSKTEELSLMASEGALIIQAHPYREASYIDHIRLFPRHVHGVEVNNAKRSPLENGMARHYADSYNLIHFAGTDNHTGAASRHLCGMRFYEPILSEWDFVEKIKAGHGKIFELDIK